MPGRIFSQLRIPTAQLDKAFTTKNPSNISITEVDSMDNIKRSSIANITKRHGSSDRNKDKENKDGNKSRSSSKDGSTSKAKSAAAAAAVSSAPVALSMIMESPPNLLIGTPAQSSGLIISGRVQITPLNKETILEDLNMYLECTTTSKKPVQDKCRECSTRVVDLYEWKFLSKPRVVSAVDGVQELPFSYLVPGHLATTTHAALGSIDYSLHIRARSSDNQTIEFRRELPLQRALVPGPEKHSVRIFPPTTLTLHATLPNIVHPIGEFPVACKMTGINNRNGDTITRWRLRKMTWRVEEHEVSISAPCPKHAGKIGGESKGIQHEFKREIGTAELKEGWKTDFEGDNGQGVVEGELHISIDPGSKPQTGVETQSASGGGAAGSLKVSHHLVLELVIAEEVAPTKRPNQVTPTGAARVLRTQFHLNLTQRAGMGLAWDDETPPVYEDVPASPPHYLGGQAPHTRVEDLDSTEAERRFSLDN